MKLWHLAGAAILAGSGSFYFLAEGKPETHHHTVHDVSEIGNGLSGYEANCSVCHGNEGVGTAKGPPLVHIIYEPGHHADVTFQRAVKYGVRQHHWRFGNMPPVQNVTEAQVDEIVTYIRALQRQAGIS